MSRIYVSALNIVVQPHPPGVYASLIKDAAALKQTAPYYGSRIAKLSNVSPIEDNEHLYAGVLNTYDRIDRDSEWYNEIKDSAAEDSDLESVNIPAHLYPNLRRMNFILDTAKHWLYFETRNAKRHSFPPANVKKVFDILLNKPELTERYGLVEIIIVPSAEALTKILSMDGLSSLKIHLVRPNPDDLTPEHMEWLQDLNEQKAQSLDYNLTKTQDDDKLEPNLKTRRIAEVAATNGYVEGRGIGEHGVKETESTRRHPMVTPLVIDALSISPFEALFNFTIGRRQR